MKILIDMQAMQTASRHRGIGRYTQSIIEALLALPHQHEIYLAFNGLFSDTIESLREKFSRFLPESHLLTWSVPGPVARGSEDNKTRALMGEYFRDAFLKNLKPDITYVTSLFEGFYDNALVSIPQNSMATALTVFDFIPLIYKNLFLEPNQQMKLWYEEKLQFAKQSQLFLTISETIRQDTIRYLQVEEEHVVNISAAVSDIWKKIHLKPEQIEWVKTRYQIRHSIILCTTSFDPHKNVKNLILAYSQLPSTIKHAHQLVIAGTVSFQHMKECQDMITKAGLLPDDVILTGYVSDEVLLFLYNMCSVFICPSLYEGFGMTALEAMSCGAAVIGSNVSSLPEVIGNKDALFDPVNPRSIANKIFQVLNDVNCQKRFQEHALIQSKAFSWEASAKKVLTAFETYDSNQKTLASSIDYFLPINVKQKLACVSLCKENISLNLKQFYLVDEIILSEAFFEISLDEYAGRIIYVIDNAVEYYPILGLLEKYPGVVLLRSFSLEKLWILSSEAERVRVLYHSHGYLALIRSKKEENVQYAMNGLLFYLANGFILEPSLKKIFDEFSNKTIGQTLNISAQCSSKELFSFIESTLNNATRQLQYQLLKNTSDFAQKLDISNLTTIIRDNVPHIKQKQILYDISELVKHDGKSGIQRVVWGYMKELLKNSPESYRFEPIYSSEHDGVYYYASAFVSRFLELPENYLQDELVTVGAGDIFLSFDLIATGFDAREKTYRAWKAKGVSFYFMLYDLLAVKHPEYFNESMAVAINAWIKQMTSVMDGALCISHAAANDLMQWLDEKGEYRETFLKLAWQHLGSDFEEKIVDVNTSHIPLAEKKICVITVGTIEIRKGHEQALDAFELLWNENIPISWIIVGKPGWKVERLINRLKTHEQKDKHLFWFDNASDELLASLYQRADGCLMASYAEGFGLPLVEATYYKLPILARDLPVFREIAGENAAYFSGNAQDLAVSLKHWHSSLIEKNAVPSTKMPILSWADCTKQMLDIILKNQWKKNWKCEHIRFDWKYSFAKQLPSFIEISGFGEREPWGRWSTMPSVSIILRQKISLLQRDLKGFIHFNVQPFMMPPLLNRQCIEAFWGNERSATFFIEKNQWISLSFSYSDWKSEVIENDAMLCIQLKLLDAAIPSVFEPTATESRLLGLGFLEFFISENDLSCTKKEVSQALPVKRKKQLLYDISELVKNDLKTGIQRVTHGYMRELLKMEFNDYVFEPIYMQNENNEGKYYYARSFLSFLKGENQKTEQKYDAPVIVCGGDIYINSEVTVTEISLREKVYQLWQIKGVTFYFFIYDLLPIFFPKYFVNGQMQAIIMWFSCIAKMADGVICISRTVADEFASWLKSENFSSKKLLSISWTHLGANIAKGFIKKDDIIFDDFKMLLSKIKKYPSLLMVGTIEPRKGHSDALKAFQLLWHKNIKVNLIVVGKKGWLVDELVDEMQNHPQLNESLFLFKEVSDEMLLELYKTASSCLMASYGEGFGLPLIEAAQFSVPILARDIPVFREVAGEHAMYFSGNEMDLAIAIESWLDLFNQGKTISSADLPWLTWSQSTEKLLEIIFEKKYYMCLRSNPSYVILEHFYSLNRRAACMDMIGFASEELWGVWTVDNKVEIGLHIENSILEKNSSGYIHIKIRPFLWGNSVDKQVVEIQWGKKKQSLVVTQPQWLCLPYELKDWCENIDFLNSSKLIITFNIPYATAPKQLDPTVNDLRKLGLGFEHLLISANEII